jgi:hypothetical protein
MMQFKSKLNAVGIKNYITIKYIISIRPTISEQFAQHKQQTIKKNVQFFGYGVMIGTHKSQNHKIVKKPRTE